MLQMVKNISLYIGCALLLSSCDNLDIKGIFVRTSDGVEKRFEQSMKINNSQTFGVEDVDDEYMFYVCADPHIDETSLNLSTFYDRLCNDETASFGVVLGDCIDRRDKQADYLDAFEFSAENHKYNNKVYHVLGNHDLFFNGWTSFKALIGPSVYWFETNFPSGKDLYIVLDTATGTLGNKQTKWLHSFLSEKRSGYRHCFILTHTNLFYKDTSQNSSGNMNFDETMSLMNLCSKQRVNLVLQGHDHYREDFVYDNVRYTIVGSIKDDFDRPEYLKVHVDEKGISFEWVVM